MPTTISAIPNTLIAVYSWLLSIINLGFYRFSLAVELAVAEISDDTIIGVDGFQKMSSISLRFYVDRF